MAFTRSSSWGEQQSSSPPHSHTGAGGGGEAPPTRNEANLEESHHRPLIESTITTDASIAAAAAAATTITTTIITSTSTTGALVKRLGFPWVRADDDQDDDSESGTTRRPQDIHHHDHDEHGLGFTPHRHRHGLQLWNRQIARYYRGVLLFTVLVIWPGGWCALRECWRSADSTTLPIRGTLAARAQDAWITAFQRPKWEDDDLWHIHATAIPFPLFILLQANGYSLTKSFSPAFTEAQSFALNLSDTIQTYYCMGDDHDHHHQNSDYNKNHSGPWIQTDTTTTTTNTSTEMDWFTVTSYYSLRNQALIPLATSMASTDGFVVLIEIQPRVLSHKNATVRDWKEKIHHLMTLVDIYTRDHPSRFFTVGFTGEYYFQRDLNVASKRDIVRMNVIVLPISWIILTSSIRNADCRWAWIIPGFVYLTSCAICYTILWIWQTWIPITQHTIIVTNCLILGTGTSQTLLFLSHYWEDPMQHRNAGIGRMLYQAGRIGIVSAMIGVCTWLWLCLPAVSTIRSIGMGGVVTIIATMLSHVIVIPALLNTALGRKGSIARDRGGSITSTNNTVSRDGSSDLGVVESSHAILDENLLFRLENSSFSLSYWVAKQLVHRYKRVILILVAMQILIPVIWHAPRLRSSTSVVLFLPGDSPSMQTYKVLQENMGHGRMSPYRVLFDGRTANVTMTSKLGFDLMNMVIQELRSIHVSSIIPENSLSRDLSSSFPENIRYESINYTISQRTPPPMLDSSVTSLSRWKPRPPMFNGICIIDNKSIAHSVYISAKVCNQVKPQCPIQLLRVINEVDKQSTNKDGRATVVEALLDVDPLSHEGLAWLRAARTIIKQMSLSNGLAGVEVHVQGQAAIEADATEVAFAMLPNMVAGAYLSGFLITVVFFKSFLLPFRFMLCQLLTVGFSLGWGVLAYQKEAFDNVQRISSNSQIFCWVAPIVPLFAIVGFGFNMDAFFTGRVLGYRMEGYDHKASIAAAFHVTGPYLFAAGSIAALAFGSLMLSSNPLFFQLSLILTAAVLVHTVIVHAIVIPSLTSIFGDSYWWPRELPRSRFFLPNNCNNGDADDVSSLLRTLEANSEYESILPVSPR